MTINVKTIENLNIDKIYHLNYYYIGQLKGINKNKILLEQPDGNFKILTLDSNKNIIKINDYLKKYTHINENNYNKPIIIKTSTNEKIQPHFNIKETEKNITYRKFNEKTLTKQALNIYTEIINKKKIFDYKLKQKFNKNKKIALFNEFKNKKKLIVNYITNSKKEISGNNIHKINFDKKNWLIKNIFTKYTNYLYTKKIKTVLSNIYETRKVKNKKLKNIKKTNNLLKKTKTKQMLNNIITFKTITNHKKINEKIKDIYFKLKKINPRSNITKNLLLKYNIYKNTQDNIKEKLKINNKIFINYFYRTKIFNTTWIIPGSLKENSSYYKYGNIENIQTKVLKQTRDKIQNKNLKKTTEFYLKVKKQQKK